MEVNLKITGSGMTVDRDITLTQAGKIIAFLGSETEYGEQVVGSLQVANLSTGMDNYETTAVRRSVREALDEARPKTHSQRIAVFGKFISDGTSDGLFTLDQIKEQYQDAREKSPMAHFSREVDNAVSSGWIAPVPGPGQKNTYYVTQKGEQAIGSLFTATSKTRVKSKSAVSKTTTVNEDDISEEVKLLQPFIPTTEGLPNYHRLSSKGLKIMWVLAMTHNKGVESLTTKEIAFIIGKLRDKIEIRDINGHTVTAAKNGWLTKDASAKYLILHDGEEHLKTLLTEDAAKTN